jgi:hypothetical protein
VLFTTTELDTRINPLTDAEFDDLDRYESGRIVQLSEIHHLLTDDQVQRLESDDWSYYNELQEELAVEMAEFLAHNGGLI